MNPRSASVNARRAIVAGSAVLGLVLATPLAEARAQGEPFTMEQLDEIVRSGAIAESRVVTIVTERCIAFPADGESMRRLRASGASESVLAAVRDACRILPGEPRWIRLEPNAVTVFTGIPIRLRVTALAPDSTMLDGVFVRWESSDSSVVAVRPDGTLEARTPGVAEVRARSRNDRVSEPATVLVTRRPPERKSTSTALVLGTVVPGGGQFYTGHGLKGALLFGGSVATTLAGFVVTSEDVRVVGPAPPGCALNCTYDVTYTRKRPAVVPALVAAGGLWAYGILDAVLQAKATQETRGPRPAMRFFASHTVRPDGSVDMPIIQIVF